jgi:hypothetical protein
MRRRFLLALADAITVALDHRDLSVMEQIQQRDNARRKNFVTFLQGTIGRQDDWLAFVPSVDDFIKQIGRLVVERQVSDLVDAEEPNVGVGAQLCGGLPESAGAGLPATTGRNETAPNGRRSLRDAEAAKGLFRKVRSNSSSPPQPRVINTDLAPIYTSAIPGI